MMGGFDDDVHEFDGTRILNRPFIMSLASKQSLSESDEEHLRTEFARNTSIKHVARFYSYRAVVENAATKFFGRGKPTLPTTPALNNTV